MILQVMDELRINELKIETSKNTSEINIRPCLCGLISRKPPFFGPVLVGPVDGVSIWSRGQALSGLTEAE
jgi:hypothetical protein